MRGNLFWIMVRIYQLIASVGDEHIIMIVELAFHLL
jgi:hypothetical protein